MNISGVSLGCDYIELWKERRKEWDGTLSSRMTNDKEEEDFWASFIEKKKRTGGDPVNSYAHRIQEALFELLQPHDRVLEIGPGWGNYTFRTAAHVEQLTCVDSSESVIDFLRKETENRQLHNISFLCEKWEQLTVKQHYDAVFGINCFYRISDIGEAVMKMNRAASRIAIAGMTSGPEKPHYLDLYREQGYSIKFRRRDYIHLQNILYQLGIMANCKIIELPRVAAYPSYEALIQDNVSKILTRDYNRQKVEQALNRYVIEKDGQYEYPYTFHAALLYWKPVK
ncbi:class I SAM-dependent methyltransferase [Domibacillus indicus]|uniref:class I SAM-dependent methyltransferase n=1 Tax=Domibacillus indicus TaxID=1437523 RepID=UPI000617AF8A|nr:class I SAM-dependent methyltransferase [Domibacillus indicus]